MTIVTSLYRDLSANSDAETEPRFECTREMFDRPSNLLQTCRDSEMAEAAHDFRNILNVVSMLSELAQLDLPAVSAAAQMLRNIRNACTDANDLCNRMMHDYCSASDDLERVNLSTLISSLSPLLATYIPAKSTLRFNLTDCVPLVDASAGGLRQVVMNLVKNAAEALADRPGTITVNTGLIEFDSEGTGKTVLQNSTTTEQYSYLSVSDNGCGMDDSTRARLFDHPFTTKKNGHGLGMVSIQRVVLRYGGVVQIQSQVGRGTQIRVLFPCAADILGSHTSVTPGGQQ